MYDKLVSGQFFFLLKFSGDGKIGDVNIMNSKKEGFTCKRFL